MEIYDWRSMKQFQLDILKEILPKGISIKIKEAEKETQFSKKTRQSETKQKINYSEEGNSTNLYYIKYGETEAFRAKNQERILLNRGFIQILNKIISHPESDPFLEKVDENIDGFEDYYQKIQNPIWIYLIKQKVQNYKYSSFNEFRSDLKLVWQNAYLFNYPETEIISIMSNFAETLFDKYLEKQKKQQQHQEDQRLKYQLRQQKKVERVQFHHPQLMGIQEEKYRLQTWIDNLDMIDKTNAMAILQNSQCKNNSMSVQDLDPGTFNDLKNYVITVTKQDKYLKNTTFYTPLDKDKSKKPRGRPRKQQDNTMFCKENNEEQLEKLYYQPQINNNIQEQHQNNQGQNLNPYFQPPQDIINSKKIIEDQYQFNLNQNQLDQQIPNFNIGNIGIDQQQQLYQQQFLAQQQQIMPIMGMNEKDQVNIFQQPSLGQINPQIYQQQFAQQQMQHFMMNQDPSNTGYQFPDPEQMQKNSQQDINTMLQQQLLEQKLIGMKADFNNGNEGLNKEQNMQQNLDHQALQQQLMQNQQMLLQQQMYPDNQNLNNMMVPEGIIMDPQLIQQMTLQQQQQQHQQLLGMGNNDIPQ